MKSRNDPRHQKREHLLQVLFAWDYRKNEDPHSDIEPIVAALPGIDQRIKEGAPMWPLEKISRVDLAVLRLALWELYHSDQETPEKVIIDEAIELGKDYGGEHSGPFINGALGTILKKYPKESQNTEITNYNTQEK